MIKHSLRLVSIICLFLALNPVMSAVISAEDGVIVTAIGQADLEDDNLARAREIALNDALRNAVEKAVGVLVSARTRVNNYQIIEDSILTKTTGYVTDYQIIDSASTYDLYQVEIKAEVEKKLLKGDLAALGLIIERANNPRVMVMIPEEHISRPAPDPAAETEIIRQLVEAGFRVVDQARVKKARSTEVSRRALQGDRDAYQQLSAKYEADILIIGEAFSELNQEYSGIESCRARLEIKVVRADTGNILLAHGVHASGADVTELTASKKALQNAGAVMAEYIIEKLPAQLTAEKLSLQLTISNITFKELREFEMRCKNTHLVDNVYVRDFSGGFAQIEVKTSLTPMQFADQIMGWDEMELEIVGLSGTKLEIQRR